MAQSVIQVSPGCSILRVVRRIQVHQDPQAFGECSAECFDAEGVVSIGGQEIPVETAYWGEAVVWVPKDGVEVPTVDR